MRAIDQTDVQDICQEITSKNLWIFKDETAYTWINPKERKQDGQLDYLDLLAHYGGEGNNVVQIKEVEALRTLLVYKN